MPATADNSGGKMKTKKMADSKNGKGDRC